MTKLPIRIAFLIMLLLFLGLAFYLPSYIKEIELSKLSLDHIKDSSLLEGRGKRDFSFGDDISYIKKGAELHLLSSSLYLGSNLFGEVSVRASEGEDGLILRTIHIFSEDGECKVIKLEEQEKSSIRECVAKKVRRRSRKGSTLSFW